MALTKVPSNLDATVATTQSASDNSTNIATTAYVTTALANLVDSAPGTLNTLNELAAALGDDASFSTTITNSIATKLPLSGGTMTGAITLADLIASGSGGLSLQTDEGTKRLFIKDNGDVKVGNLAVSSATTAPLHVAKASADVQAVFGDNNSSIDDPSIRIIGRDSSNSAIRYTFTGLDADNNFGFIGYNAGSGGFVNALTFDTSGKVGIGTSSPDGNLHILHGSTNTFTASNDSWHTMVIHNNASAATNTTGIAFEVSGSAYHGNAGTGIAAVKNGTNSDYGADLVFITRPQSAVAAERMRITDGGNVGIGTTNTNAQATLSVVQEDTGNNTTSAINFHGTGNGSDGTTTTNLFRAVTNNANNWAHGKMFADGFTFTYGNTNTNRLKIENDGQIQIGSSNVGTDIVKFIGNTNINPPNTANHATGTRLSLYDANSTAWYALGIESNSMWLNSDMNFKFYVDAVEKVRIDGSDNPSSGEGTSYPVIQVGTAPSHMHGLGTVKVELPSSYPTSVKLMTAEPSEAINIHGGTNSVGSWDSLGSGLPNAFRGMTFLNTINTSQQADPVFYLSTAMEVILIRYSGWNAIAGGDFPLTATGAGGNLMWQELSDGTTHGTFADILTGTVNKVYRAYLPAGRHKLDNDSAIYFFAGHNGGRIL